MSFFREAGKKQSVTAPEGCLRQNAENDVIWDNCTTRRRQYRPSSGIFDGKMGESGN